MVTVGQSQRTDLIAAADGDLTKHVVARITEINNWHNSLDEMLEHCKLLARYLNAKRKEQAQ